MMPHISHSPFSAQILVSLKPNPITNILAFDLEWSLTKDEYEEYPIIAAGFCDSLGYYHSILLEDFKDESKPEKVLVNEIIKIIARYDYSVGFYSMGVRTFNPIRHALMGRDSDLIQLHRRLIRHELKSPIEISEHTQIPYLVGERRDHTHLDAYNLLTNKVIKSSIYGNSYNSNDLDTISRAILGSEGGKYGGIKGPIFESLTDEDEKRKYVFSDAKLLLDCIAHNNYELLKVMHLLSELTGISFRNICNTKGVTKIWTPVLDNLVRLELNSTDGQSEDSAEVYRFDVLSKYFERKGNFTPGIELEIETPTKGSARYIGGWVMKPMPGEYHNVSVFDITSLYPAMIVNNNISFETVDCNCCRGIKSAKVPKYLFEGERSNSKSKIKLPHICQKYKGILTRQISDYMQKRIEFKHKFKEMQSIDRVKAREYEIISNSYKILINSVYGQMGHKFAKYENVVAAELVTRFGRATIQHCAKIAKEVFGWNIIYGDTDSLFIDSEIDLENAKLFIETCKRELNVNMELDKIYKKFLISGAKNYVGITKDSNKIVIKGLAGKKSDRCLWVRNCFKQMIEDYKNGVNPCINLRNQIDLLRSNNLGPLESQLMIFKQLNKSVDAYKINVVQKILGLKKNLEEGDTVRYYLADRDVKYTENASEICINEYKKQLINTVKPVLKLLKFDAKKQLDVVLSKDTTANSMSSNEDALIDENPPIVSIDEKPKNLKIKVRSASTEIIQLK
jgi:DNA polymerase elongation subunit (family B)